MESALPLLLFLAFLFGSTLLVLICGYQGLAEEESEPSTTSDAAFVLEDGARFFGRPGSGSLENPVAVVVDEAFVHRVEDFLREEMSMAEVFVDAPSAELLHRHRGEPEPSPALFKLLKGYLEREHEAAASFVSNPSVESFHGGRVALAAVC